MSTLVLELEGPRREPWLVRRARQCWPFNQVHVGEGRCLAVLTAYAFILLVCYYTLKTLREPLLLETGSAALKSYANATVAGVLLVFVPVYAAIFRRVGKRPLCCAMTVFFAVTLELMCVFGRAGHDIGFIYYVWVGVFGLTALAQFWARAAHIYGIESGQRLFPVIMIGAVAGGLAGPAAYSAAIAALGAWNLLTLMAGVLLTTCPLIWGMRAEETGSGPAAISADPPPPGLGGGFALILADRYLLLLAALTVLLNCVNTMGEYMLAELVLRHVEARAMLDPTLERDAAIGTFYAGYYFSVNLLTVVMQILLVGRLFRSLGVSGALLVMPVIAVVSYGIVAFVPVFAILRLIKCLENSADYSLMNTARHALYLPLPVELKYQGKTAIDTFFWRFGDVAQAGLVFVGLNAAGFELHDFALLNMGLALVWLLLALRIGRYYRQRAEPRTPHRTEPVSAAKPGPAAGGLALAAAVCVMLVLPVTVAAGQRPLFEDDGVLELEIELDMRALCRDPTREGCRDVAAVVRDAADPARSIRAEIRSRGRWQTGDCTFPALFVFLDESSTAGTQFEGQSMLPLTTHCRKWPGVYEQYVLAEYFAYRIYNTLTAASLRVRLARIRYVDVRRPDKPVTRYGFFTEHFESLARRINGRVATPQRLALLEADPHELGRLELFQFMIGNTDWSAVFGHNVVILERAESGPIAVPYDFDYAGLVDADYAVPPAELPIGDVRQRLFRGFCKPAPVWKDLRGELDAVWPRFERLAFSVPDWNERRRDQAMAYLRDFRARKDLLDVIAESCRSAPH